MSDTPITPADAAVPTHDAQGAGAAAACVLSDATIFELVQEGRIRIDPWDPALVQPASVDLRVGDSFRVFHNHRASAIDLCEPPENLTEEVVVGVDQSFVIHPGEFCLGRTLEWVELPDDIVARIEGKALALDTPVPTADGWATMGSLQPGESVFDRRGRPTPVVAVSEEMAGRPCRAVEFSDRTTIVADLDHQWQVRTRDERGGIVNRIVTTAEMEHGLACAGQRYVVGNAPALRCELPEPPVGALVPRPGDRASMVTPRARSRLLRVARGASRTEPPKDLLASRHVAAVTPCPSVSVRCIEVGAADGIYLVGRSFIPTHNSSLGRLGLIVHATAGFCDPGWKGTLTLELNNLTRIPIKLYPGLLIAQLSFMALDRPALRPYGSPELGSHYQGQRAATESRYRGARATDPGKMG